MSTSTRYQFVKNTLGAAFTTSNFPVISDGDDRQTKSIKRVLSADDIGTGAGKVGHASGAIVTVIPNTYNVLWVKGLTYRPIDAVAGVTPYVLMDNNAIGASVCDISYSLGLDNTIRVTDLSAGTEADLAAGDIVTVEVTIGQALDSSDSMN